MNARDGFRNGIEMMQQSARLMSAVMPGRGLFGDWREFDNKIEAFRLFQYADRELGLPIERTPLDHVASRALAEEPFRAIWVLEGVGHIAGNCAGLAAEGLLTDGAAVHLPGRTFIPLHAGMGTAFGEKLLASLGSNPSRDQLREIVGRFMEICRRNCRRGWEDACMEPLGLVVRCLYPGLLNDVASAMTERGSALRRLYWHGVGRSLYFVPTNFLPLPGAHERMLRGAVSEAGNDGAARRNILAGLVWAVALVNLRRPAVIASLAAVCRDLDMREEFTNGLISALLAWRHMAPSAAPDAVNSLAPYTRAAGGTDRNAALWEEWIAAPARDALANLYPGLELRNNIPALYTFRTSQELAELSALPAGKSS